MPEWLNPYALSSAMLIGILASAHCVAMCSPIAAFYKQMILPSQARQRGRILQGAFYIGRICTYMLFGVLAALTFYPLFSSNSVWLVRLLIAALMLSLGVSFLLQKRQWLLAEQWGQRLWQKVQPLTQRFFPVDSIGKAWSLGLLWGLLPCGLLYSTALLAGSLGKPLHAALFMLLFGIANSMAVAGGAHALTLLQKRWLQKGLAIWLILLAALTLAAPFWASENLPEAVRFLMRFCLPAN